MWRAARSWMRRRWSRRCKTSALPARRSTCSARDRKSTRLNSSHSQISYAVFCLKKKKGKGSEWHGVLVGGGAGPYKPVLDDLTTIFVNWILMRIGRPAGVDTAESDVSSAAIGG